MDLCSVTVLVSMQKLPYSVLTEKNTFNNQINEQKRKVPVKIDKKNGMAPPTMVRVGTMAKRNGTEYSGYAYKHFVCTRNLAQIYLHFFRFSLFFVLHRGL